MNYVSWQHEAVLLERYPLVAWDNRAQHTSWRALKQRAGLDHDFGKVQEIQLILVTAMRHILLLFNLC